MKMEGDLNYKVNIRQPQFKGIWKTTSILGRMEDDHNCIVDRRRPKFIC